MERAEVGADLRLDEGAVTVRKGAVEPLEGRFYLTSNRVHLGDLLRTVVRIVIDQLS